MNEAKISNFEIFKIRVKPNFIKTVLKLIQYLIHNFLRIPNKVHTDKVIVLYLTKLLQL